MLSPAPDSIDTRTGSLDLDDWPILPAETPPRSSTGAGLYDGPLPDPFQMPARPALSEAKPTARPERNPGNLWAGHRRLSLPQSLAHGRGPVPAEARLTDSDVLVYAYLVDRTSSATGTSKHTINFAEDSRRCAVSPRTLARAVDALVAHGLVADARPRKKGKPRQVAVLVAEAEAAPRFDIPVAVLWPVKGEGPRWGSETAKALRALLALWTRIGFATHVSVEDSTAEKIAAGVGWHQSGYWEALAVLRRGDPAWLHVTRRWDPQSGWQVASDIEFRFDLLPAQSLGLPGPENGQNPEARPKKRQKPDSSAQKRQKPESAAPSQNGQNPGTEKGQNPGTFLASPDTSVGPDPSLPGGSSSERAPGDVRGEHREGGTGPVDARAKTVSGGSTAKTKAAKTGEKPSAVALVTRLTRDEATDLLRPLVEACGGTAGMNDDAWAALVLANIVHGRQHVTYDALTAKRVTPRLLKAREKGWGALRLAGELSVGSTDEQLLVGAIWKRLDRLLEAGHPRADEPGTAVWVPEDSPKPAPRRERKPARAADRDFSAADYGQPMYPGGPVPTPSFVALDLG
jgi:hypothetical protein